MSKYTASIGSKLDWRQKELWDKICEYRGQKSAEYLRQLVLAEIERVQSTKRYVKWLEKREGKAKQ